MEIKKVAVKRATGIMRASKPEDIERRKKREGLNFYRREHKRNMRAFRKTIKTYHEIKYEIDEKTFDTEEEAIDYKEENEQ